MKPKALDKSSREAALPNSFFLRDVFDATGLI
jgi:hypothetical protein